MKKAKEIGYIKISIYKAEVGEDFISKEIHLKGNKVTSVAGLIVELELMKIYLLDKFQRDSKMKTGKLN